MIFFLILLIASFSLAVSLLGRRSLRLKGVSESEILSRIDETKFFWTDFYEMFYIPTFRFYQEKTRPFVFKEIEKLTHRFRIIVLRTECLLMRFGEYVRGKRVVSPNGHKSHYWEQINNCKNNGADNGGNGDKNLQL